MAKPTKDPNGSRVAAGNLDTGERSAATVRRAPTTPASGAPTPDPAPPNAAEQKAARPNAPRPPAASRAAAPAGPATQGVLVRGTRPIRTPRAREQPPAAGRPREPGATGDQRAWAHRDVDTGRWPGPSTRPPWNGAAAVTESGLPPARTMAPSTRRMYRRRRRTVVLVLVLLVGLVAMISRCGGDDAGGAGKPASRPVAPPAAEPTTTGGAPTTAPGAGPTTAGTGRGTAQNPGTAAGPVPRTAAGPAGRTMAGAFAFAGNAGPVLGTAGVLRRFKVAVEKGQGEATADFANAIDRTLGDPRSWIAGGQFRLQRVPAGSTAEFTIYLASAGTSQQMCAGGGLNTGGFTSCRLPGRVIINLDRWRHAVGDYGAPLATYQAYAINHEVGHQFGHGHEACPGAGHPAPVMQQQTYGLQGCLPNAWPYVRGKRYVGAPVA